MVDIGLDFSMLPQGRVAFEDIDRFEVCNSGKVGVYVYEPLSVEWSVLGPSTVRPLREPSVDKPYQHEIILLLHRKHYSLIYNFSQTSSLRSQNLPEEMRRGTTHWHTCPRCQANMKTEQALRMHLRKSFVMPLQSRGRPRLAFACLRISRKRNYTTSLDRLLNGPSSSSLLTWKFSTTLLWRTRARARERLQSSTT